MSISFNCPACKKPYRVKEELARKTARCVCGQQIKVPAPAAEPIADLSDLFDEAAEPTTPPALASSKPRSDSHEADWGLAGHSVDAPLCKLLENTRSPLLKLVIGAAVGALVAISAITTKQQGQAMDLTSKILATIGASVAGIVAAGLLIVADAVGKRSAAARWLTLIGLMIAIAIAVVGYFMLEAFRMDQRAKHASRYHRQRIAAADNSAVDIGSVAITQTLHRDRPHGAILLLSSTPRTHPALFAAPIPNSPPHGRDTTS